MKKKKKIYEKFSEYVVLNKMSQEMHIYFVKIKRKTMKGIC